MRSEFALDLAVSAFELNESALDLDDPTTELKESARQRKVSPPKDFAVGEDGESRVDEEHGSEYVVVGVRFSDSEFGDSWWWDCSMSEPSC